MVILCLLQFSFWTKGFPVKWGCPCVIRRTQSTSREWSSINNFQISGAIVLSKLLLYGWITFLVTQSVLDFSMIFKSLGPFTLNSITGSGHVKYQKSSQPCTIPEHSALNNFSFYLLFRVLYYCMAAGHVVMICIYPGLLCSNFT